MTEWKRAQDALENQLRFLQHLIDTFPNPIFYSDTHGRYLGCNSAFAQFIGKRFEEIDGKTNHEILDPLYADLFEDRNDELIKNPGIVTYSGMLPYANGSFHEITIQKSIFTSIGGTLAGIVGLIFSDQKN